jgi:transglutaminase-like putative cysteine protease
MKRRILTLACFACIASAARSGDIAYPVSSIPAALLKNAHVVKRMDDTRVEIVSTHEVIYRNRYAVTIFDEEGLRYSRLVASYDKLRKIQDIDGHLYDARGVLLKSVKQKDIRDYSNVSDGSFMEDARVKVYDFVYRTYPFTVEFETTTRLSTTYFLPGWMPLDDEHLSVEKSSFTLVAPEDYAVRTKVYNYPGQPVVSVERGKKITAWSVSNLSAFQVPFAAPNWEELTTSVHLAPSAFEMEGYKGSATTWQDFGKFSYDLNLDRDKLPETIVQKVKQVTAGVTDDREKVRRLYEFMQQNTRYISIQLGIGGWQTFEAKDVAQNGYGDCKALSNYMYSLLKVAGIKSYPTLARAGDNARDRYLMEDLPSNQFNHVILCVPMPTDSIWLECTSQSVPAGYMGGFTGNRKVLLITENGGKLVSTPRYGRNENVTTRSIKGRVDENGNLELNARTIYRAMEQERKSMMLTELSKDKVKEVLNEELGIASYDVNNFKYTSHKGVIPEMEETLDITVNNFATITGKRLFIQPNILNRGGLQLPDEERTVDIEFSSEYRNIDTVEIALLPGYEVESLPAPVSLKTPFGSYLATVSLQQDKLVYIRQREQYAGRFPASRYKDVIAYYNAIYKADRTRVVLVRK